MVQCKPFFLQTLVVDSGDSNSLHCADCLSMNAARLVNEQVVGFCAVLERLGFELLCCVSRAELITVTRATGPGESGGRVADC